MLRVFLVEDESIIRETLRDTVPWTQYGYTFVGEAGDGELALPLIRQTKPDLLITDIRMPFMDGLALSKMVLREFPQMKVIIISGYDDFEYAQQAIGLGVERYLLKPVTKSNLLSVLEEVKTKIESERAQQNYRLQFQQEAQEYEQYARRRFFEHITAGHLPLPQIYERAQKLDLDLRAQAFTILLLPAVPEKHGTTEAYSEPGARIRFTILLLPAVPEKHGTTEAYSEPGARIRDGMVAHFLKYPEYILFRWNFYTYAVLIKGDIDQIEKYVERCISTVQELYETHSPELNWYVAVGTTTQRLSALPACFEEVSRLWAYRHILPSQHILRSDTVSFLTGTGMHGSGIVRNT